jgi:hypothetical protein
VQLRIFFAALLALLAASRLCHTRILWEGDTLPLATAGQMLHGKTIYRDIWYDKPPLVAAFHLLADGRDGWPLRIVDALYALLACWIAYRFAREMWSVREGVWAAGLMGFFLIFDFPASVIPVGSDLLMLAPHLAAVWLAWKRRPFWCGAMVGVALWASPKALLVLAVCALWDLGGLLSILAGFAMACAAGAIWLAAAGALLPYWDEVWIWGRLYAGSPFVADPIRNGLARTANWTGFHVAAVAAAGLFLWKSPSTGRPGAGRITRWQWAAWLAIALIGVAAGLRFFPRYYFLLLPVVVTMAARGFTLMGKRGYLAALLLLIPVARFAPAYWTALTDAAWRDTAMDRDSRAAAALTRQLAKPGDTLFIWGYRPEIFVYTQMPAATMYLDSQPLTGVPADRHLTQSEPVEHVEAAQRRAALRETRPAFVLDGLGLFNPHLAIGQFPELRDWFAQYREVGRSGQTVVYGLRGRF